MDATPLASARQRIARFLRHIERTGNALPHPATVFAGLAVFVAVASCIASWLGVSTVHPGTGEVLYAVNLLSAEGAHRLLAGLVSNFTGFAPLGAVAVSLLGLGVAERSGLIDAALRRFLFSVSPGWVVPAVVFAGVMSNVASDIGYVLLIPLGGLVLQGAGRHPVIGMAAAFAGVSGGYSANLLLGSLDPMLAGVTQEAARIVAPDYTVNAAANWYFMIASTPLVVALGTWVTELAVAPRFTHLPDADPAHAIAPPDAREQRGLRWALVVTVAMGAWAAWGLLPADGFLRAGDGSLSESAPVQGVVAMLFAWGVLAGLAYGFGARTLRSDADVVDGMVRNMGTLATYFVIVFFAAQFVALFAWSQLGMLVAVQLASVLQAVHMPAVVALVGLVALTALANLGMGAASAKWALMAPVFVPMFMLLGVSPEATQAGYRVGDSVTNLVSPMMGYTALVLACFQRHDPKAGVGTLVATMLPYAIAFGIGWTLLLVAWAAFGLPLGPGAPFAYPAG
jgi:aminobenzoyl-glutamate transport protein